MPTFFEAPVYFINVIAFIGVDLRNSANAAKTVSELEKLLNANPRLLEIEIVNNCVSTIKTFGKNIRMLAQDRLLAAIVEKNQAAIAGNLQVFYNLESLPAIILAAIDNTVKRTVESSRAALDIESIHSLLNDSSSHAHTHAHGLGLGLGLGGGGSGGGAGGGMGSGIAGHGGLGGLTGGSQSSSTSSSSSSLTGLQAAAATAAASLQAPLSASKKHPSSSSSSSAAGAAAGGASSAAGTSSFGFLTCCGGVVVIIFQFRIYPHQMHCW
jgi:hypothetical protein